MTIECRTCGSHAAAVSALACLAAGGTPLPAGDMVAIPQRPGHGSEPGLAVLERYRVS